jgi:hypothetical protein
MSKKVARKDDVTQYNRMDAPLMPAQPSPISQANVPLENAAQEVIRKTREAQINVGAVAGKMAAPRPAAPVQIPGTKPMPSYDTGVASVPVTGPAIVHEGEKITPASQNPDNPDNDQDLNQELNAGMRNTPQNTTPVPVAPQGIPMISPDRSDTRVVPSDQQGAAANAGWEPAHKMVHPQTQDKRWVPASQSSDAMKAGYVSADIPAAQTPTKPFQGLGTAAKEQAIGLVTGGGMNPVSLAQNIYHGITEDIPAVYKAYESARQSGASIGDAYAAANNKAKEIQNAKNGLTQAIKEFQTNPNKAAWNAVLQLGTLALGSEVLAPEAEAATETAAETTAPEPGRMQQVLKGKNVVQPQAQETLRAGVRAGGENAGLSTVQGKSLRDVMTEPIEKLHAQASESYKALDEAAGTDIKALRDGLKNDQYNRTLLGNTPEDVAKAEKLDASIKDTQQKIDDAEAKVAAKGIDPKLADKQFTKAKAAEEFRDRIFHNQSVVQGDVEAGQPETVNVDAAVRESQKLMDKDKYGDSRLEQFMGKDGAKEYMKDLRQLQQQGVHAMKVQAIAKMVGKYIALPLVGAGVGAGVYEAAHELSK